MIPGTRARKSKNNSETPTTELNPPATNAANLDRRELFESLVPALGAGLAKLLRASNNLKRDLNEELSERAKNKKKAAERG